MERISIRVDEQLKREIEAEAKELGVRPSDVVRRVLQRHVILRTPRMNAREHAEKLGIVGSAKGLPTDLSTNPAHMEGFGE